MTSIARRPPLFVTTNRATGSTSRDAYVSPRRRPERIHDGSAYKPPLERLVAALQECQDLDRELKILENSGHTRLGVFAKPLVEKRAIKSGSGSSSADDHATSDKWIQDEDCSDPFFHQFYDEHGRSMFEQLLRGRMRVLSLTKFVYGRTSIPFVRAETELAEAYARMNLWKQGHIHVSTAMELLNEIVAQRELKAPADQKLGDAHDAIFFRKTLEYFYELQLNNISKGKVHLTEFLSEIQSWSSQNPKRFSPLTHQSNPSATIFSEESLKALFSPSPSSAVHWQQLILTLEQQNQCFQQYLLHLEAILPEMTLNTLRNLFVSLDPSQDGLVPLQAYCLKVQSMQSHDSTVQVLSQSLSRLLSRIGYHSITWSEILMHTSDSQLYDDDINELQPRLKLFMGRLFLRRGQLDDAVQYFQLAIAEQEQVVGSESSSLVKFYLLIAEALAVRFKQFHVVAQQNALELAEKWLESVEGRRSLRTRAIQLIDEECQQSGVILRKKEAEASAQKILKREQAMLSLVRPDPAMIDDAIEFCTKAWSLQEAHYGREHITTAAVHVTLAQIYLLKNEAAESIRSFTKAIEIYEAACNGPVPASSFLRLEMAKVYQQEQDLTHARRMYLDVGEFFHSFAQEFAGCDTTRRECCAHAIDAFRQWGSLAGACTLEEQKQVLIRTHQVVVDGYGEFSIEASESAKNVGRLLSQMGQLKAAERYLKTACYILESHFGPNDRRYRRLRKEVVEITAQIKDSTLHSEEKDDATHAWLVV